MKRRKNLLQSLYPDEETFQQIGQEFTQSLFLQCLERVWEGWELVLEKEFASKNINPFKIDWLGIRQRERTLAFLHFIHIQECQSPLDPFIVIHEAPELESSHSDSAMPPAYDFSFYRRGGNRRIALPVEAKYLKNEKDIRRICLDLTDKYLTSKGSPFSQSAALVGYLLSGKASDAFNEIEKHLSLRLSSLSHFANKPHRESTHLRKGADFACHWLMCSWSNT